MSPPNKPIDSEDYDKLFLKMAALTDANMQLANAVLAQSQAQNRIVPLMTQIRNDVHDLLNSDELVKANLEQRLRNIDTNVALILNDVGDVKGDVDTVRKDVTNSRIALPVAQPEDKPANGFVASVREFDKLPTSSKLMVLFAFVVFGLSGWLRHLLSGSE